VWMPVVAGSLCAEVAVVFMFGAYRLKFTFARSMSERLNSREGSFRIVASLSGFP
jgi:hypothetical protein